MAEKEITHVRYGQRHNYHAKAACSTYLFHFKSLFCLLGAFLTVLDSLLVCSSTVRDMLVSLRLSTIQDRDALPTALIPNRHWARSLS